MKILVTGAAGFIGSHITLELLNVGYDVVCIDNFVNAIQDADGNAASLKRVEKLTGKPAPFTYCDLCNNDQLEQVFKKNQIDGVIHLAALKAVGDSMERPLEYYRNNLLSSINLICFCKKYGVKNFVFSSSSTVYGVPETFPLYESSRTGFNVTSPYGQTKYMTEKILIDTANKEKDWNVILLRYFNPIGAHPSGLLGEDPRGVPLNLIPYVSQVAIGRLPHLRVFGNTFNTPDGTGIRDYIHIMDLARGHVVALDRLRKAGNIGCEIYNLGTGRGHSVLEVVDSFKRVSGKEIKVQICEKRAGDVDCLYCDASLAKEKLGWECELDLDDMCRDMWNFQLKNPNGYASE
ncbi:UDP-glucose 4-epimerase [Toxocara canis]|uniref:UDP-glucose 4-epimerase n=1 Tax=Toxocara canis TaxID=6265 RepID=A0A0B2VJT3_TOXCA|nr:UDP-glucose 4-epimerase [Toxocara canis]